MKVSETQYRNEERMVIVVDAQKFLSLWRAHPRGPHAEISQGDVHSWRKDYKFEDAEDGFSKGIENPVPLAHVSSHPLIDDVDGWEPPLLYLQKLQIKESVFAYASFTDGITRTIWLLANGVKAFPVECAFNQAPTLSRYAGLLPGKYDSVAHILETKKFDGKN